MATYQISVTWDTKINNLYKDITLIQQGISAKLNISLRNVSRVTVNYKVNNEYFTDLCEIDLDNNKVIVPFKREVLQVGTQQLELVCHMKNGDVLPTPTYSYTVTRSLSNEGGIPGDEETLSVLRELINSITENEAIVEQAEAERQAAELHRVNNEDNRVNQEAIRQANENTRQANENTRQYNESNRQSNESNRQQYENTRRASEDSRLTDEASRDNAELQRIAAENERLRKEIERQNNESIRQEFYDSFNSQLEQNMKDIESLAAGYVNVDSFGAKKDDSSFDNAEIFNYVLNNYTNVIINGNYYTSDITVNQSISIKGNAELNNKNCTEHVIRFNSNFVIENSLYVHGMWKYINGIVINNANGSQINKITARGCYKCGVVTLPNGNSNSVYADYIRTEANGAKFKFNNYIVENTNTGTGFGASATITINDTLPVNGDNTIFSFIEFDNKLYTVTSVNGNILTVYPHFKELPTGELTLFIGGGLFFYPHQDSNVWTINKFTTTDYSVGYYCDSMYGHTISSSLAEGPRVGFAVGVKASSYKNYIGHSYVEGDVTYPFVFGPCKAGTTEITIEYPLDSTFKIYDINLERDLYSLTKLNIQRYGVTPATDVNFKGNSGSGTVQLREFSKMIIQALRGEERTVELVTSNHNYYPFANDSILAQGTMTELYLLPLTIDRQVTFISADGFTVNLKEAYTVTIPANQRLKISFFRTNNNWFLIEQQIY